MAKEEKTRIGLYTKSHVTEGNKTELGVPEITCVIDKKSAHDGKAC
jgi:hypothetical protein